MIAPTPLPVPAPDRDPGPAPAIRLASAPPDTTEGDRFDHVTRVVARLLDVPIAVVTLADPDDGPRPRPGSVVPPDLSLGAYVVLDDQPIVVPDTSRDLRFAGHPLVTGEPYVHAFAGRALHAPDGRRIGSLCVFDHRARHFTEHDLATLEDLSGWAETELRLNAVDATRRRLLAEVDELRRTALLDPATGAWTRTAIEDVLARELERSRRHGDPVAALRLEIDGLEGVRFAFGDEVADDVLREAATRTRRGLRAFDALGRFGTDGLLILLVRCGLAQAQTVAARVGRCLRDQPIELPGDGPIELTASIGLVAGVSVEGEKELQQWLDLVDRCQRGARRLGGDRIHAAAFDARRNSLWS